MRVILPNEETEACGGGVRKGLAWPPPANEQHLDLGSMTMSPKPFFEDFIY